MRRRTGGVLVAGCVLAGAALLAPGLGRAGTVPDTTPPTAPEVLSLRHTLPGGVSVQWSLSTDDVDVAEYRIFRNGVQVGRLVNDTLARLEKVSLISGVRDVPPGDSWFQVQAVDSSGNVSVKSAPARIYIDNSVPSAPRDFSIDGYDPTTGCMQYSWSYNDDDVRPLVAALITQTGAAPRRFPMRDDTQVGPDRFAGEYCRTPDGSVFWYQLEVQGSAFRRSVKTPPIRFQYTTRYAPTGFQVNPGTDGGYTATWNPPQYSVGAVKFVVLNRLEPIAEVAADQRRVSLDLDPTRTHWLQLVTIDEWGNESRRTAPVRIDPTDTGGDTGSDMAPTITVNAHMFWDANLNGIRDPGETALRAGVVAASLQPEAEPRDLPLDQRGSTQAFLTPEDDGRTSITFELFNFDDGARCNTLSFAWEPASDRPPEELPVVSSATPPFVVGDRVLRTGGDICIGDSDQRQQPGPTIDTDPFEVDVTVAFAGRDPELRS